MSRGARIVVELLELGRAGGDAGAVGARCMSRGARVAAALLELGRVAGDAGATGARRVIWGARVDGANESYFIYDVTDGLSRG